MGQIDNTATDRISKLAYRFRQQERFCLDYSPLYAAIFGTVARWLASEQDHPLATWLLNAAAGRSAFDTAVLLPAALHYQVLTANESVSRLARFYPSVGGTAIHGDLYEGETGNASPSFVAALKEAIFNCTEPLGRFIQTYTVQTNETGRGIAWLLPAAFGGWDGCHLLDLGASAGLNLVAEQRSFHFVDQKNGESLGKLGLGKEEQFSVSVGGTNHCFTTSTVQYPTILSRNGCDLRPFHLNSRSDELALSAFVWADQPIRLQRLQQGITALRHVNRSKVPVCLAQANLPLDLPEILDTCISSPTEPVVIYNTYIKMYLPDKGRALRRIIAEWARRQVVPVIWIQWEPPAYVTLETGEAPADEWLAWTADSWQNGEHHQWHLGWVHPHGHKIVCLPGLDAWRARWQQ